MTTKQIPLPLLLKLGKIITVKIDRPLGSHHPEHNFRYPINYGYVPNHPAPDGDCLDAYVLGVEKPVQTFTGKCIAIIHRTDDNDDKLVLAPSKTHFKADEILAAVKFQEQYFQSIVIMATED